jgi:hypothetical protein
MTPLPPVKAKNPIFLTLGRFDSPNATYHSVNPHDRS